MKLKSKNIVVTMLSIFALLTFLGCGKDESKNNSINEIIGKWSYNKRITNGINQNLTACDKNRYIQFNNDNSFERKDYHDFGKGCVVIENSNGTYVYDVSANRITLKFIDITEGEQIEILNNVEIVSTTLKFSWDENNDGRDEHQCEYIK